MPAAASVVGAVGGSYDILEGKRQIRIEKKRKRETQREKEKERERLT